MEPDVAGQADEMDPLLLVIHTIKYMNKEYPNYYDATIFIMMTLQ